MTVHDSVSVGGEEEDVEDKWSRSGGTGRSEEEVSAPNIFLKADISVKLPNVGTRPIH